MAEAAEAMHESVPVFQRIALQGTEKALRELWRRVKAPRNLKLRIASGTTIDLVLREVESSRADLLLLGINGAKERTRGAGMMATRCLRKARSKVMLVRDGKTQRFREIVACIDFSETAREVVRQALLVAKQDGSRVQFLHVYRAPWRRFGFRMRTAAESVAFAQDYRNRKLAALEAFVGDTQGVKARFRLVDANQAGAGIAQEAKRVKADLIVLGRRGRTELGYLLMGSTVERLARELDCSLLAVPRVDAAVHSTPPKDAVTRR
jgi:nucleotide-binding universal stress UspA family protein